MRSISSSRADRNRIGTSDVLRISRQTSRPSNSGMPMSSTIRSGLSAAKRVNASLPSRASITSMPAFFKATRMTSRIWPSSSTMRMRCAKNLSAAPSARRLIVRHRVQPALKPPVPEAPAPPGQILTVDFYKPIAPRHKAVVARAMSDDLVEGRQGLRAEAEQVVGVDAQTLTRHFVAMAQIVVGDEGIEVHQRAA